MQQCLALFTMLLVEGSYERDFLDIYLITFFGVRNCGNTSAMRVMFFFKKCSNIIHISEIQREIEQKSFVSEITVFELVALNSLY